MSGKNKKFPPGMKLRHTLRGHEDRINRIAWSPDGKRIASPSYDDTVGIWNTETGKLQRAIPHRNQVYGVAWSPDGRQLASGQFGHLVLVWDSESGDLVRKFPESKGGYGTWVKWSVDGAIVASGANDGPILLRNVENGEVKWSYKFQDGSLDMAWSPDGKIFALTDFNDFKIRLVNTQRGNVVGKLNEGSSFQYCLSWSQDGGRLASGSENHIHIWDIKTLRMTHLIEAHSNFVAALSFSSDGKLLASKSDDHTVRIWCTDTWTELARLTEKRIPGTYRLSALAFHPSEPVLATLGEDDRVIRIWDLDYSTLLGRDLQSDSSHYRNAKVVLLGDTGVGKSGLGLVLSGKQYKETDSTDGRNVYTFEEKEVAHKASVKETRETLLWDMAGQPGYRLIHQMHLNEVAVALLVFDARSETDPLAGVRHWDRALRQAQKRQANAAIPLKKFLVAARTDRGGIAISKERLEKVKQEMKVDGYFETSAKQGWQVKELIARIKTAIAWDALPKVTSTKLFHTIKEFILQQKKTGRLLITSEGLMADFMRCPFDQLTGRELMCNALDMEEEESPESLTLVFDTCVSRLENRDLVRRLSFGNFILLQPEYLDAYASAIINAAKTEPDGLGSIPEEVALACQFQIAGDVRIKNRKQEELVLIPTIKELLDYDLVLREHADDAVYLVFPSQFLRDWPDAPNPEGKSVVITFEGPVQHIYATLAVRLSHSGLFTSKRSEMWRNAAIFEAAIGGQCGLLLREFSEGEGELTLFYTPQTNAQTRFQFENYVLTHLDRRAIDETVKLVRLFVCNGCGTSVPDRYVSMLLERGLDRFDCPCGEKVSLMPPKEQAKLQSRVTEMDDAADYQRSLNSAAMTLRGKIETNDYDVFLCHNSQDKVRVRQMADNLMEQGILPWLDERDIKPGTRWQDALEEQIGNIKSAAIFIGPTGMSPWHNIEFSAFLDEFIKRKCPVIPVILKGVETLPELPRFLTSFHAVDFRKNEPDPLKQLIWGITGKRSLAANL